MCHYIFKTIYIAFIIERRTIKQGPTKRKIQIFEDIF